jgi:hypothetical protein
LRPVSRSDEEAPKGRTQSKQPVAPVTQALEMRWQKITSIRSKAMPNVRGKKYPYTKKGVAAAKKAAAKNKRKARA